MHENPYKSPDDNSNPRKVKRKLGRAMLVTGLPIALAIALATTCIVAEIASPDVMLFQLIGLIVATWASMLVLQRIMRR